MATATASSSLEHSWISAGSRRNSIESVLSIQGRETDYVRDTTDTETLDEEALEYEPVTQSEAEDGPVPGDDDSSGDSDKDIIRTRVIEVRVRDDGDLVFADSEQTDSEGSDSEIDLHDYWQCAQCCTRNNNPLYRYCEKCFKVRKNFFPPRPKRKGNSRPKPATDPEPLPITTVIHQLTEHTDSGLETAFTSQEFSSQHTTQTESTSTNVCEPVAALSRFSRKRRADSVDKNAKRSKLSDSDETDIENDTTNSSNVKISPLIKTLSDPALTIDSIVEQKDDNVCIMCFSEPKSGVFVHGRIAHICCCYKCAVKVWAKAKRCPICNCKVSNVLKAVVM